MDSLSEMADSIMCMTCRGGFNTQAQLAQLRQESPEKLPVDHQWDLVYPDSYWECKVCQKARKTKSIEFNKRASTLRVSNYFDKYK